jgi:Ca-activated chloride channel family protein
MIVDRVGPDDIISVIAFSDRAQLIRPASPLKSKATLISQINEIRAVGGTEIYQGLEAGLAEIRRSNLGSFNNHMILLTDGHTYGDARECMELAREAAVMGIDISAFGIGSDWNDTFLDKLVAMSGSQSVYVENPSQVFGHLQERIRELGVVYASSLRLISDFPPGIALLSAFKVAPYAQHLVPNGSEIRLGSVEAESTLAVLLEFEIEIQETEKKFRLPLRFVADISSEQKKDYSFDSNFDLVINDDKNTVDPPAKLVKAVRALNFYRMNERIWHDIEVGELTGATKRLQRLNTRLIESGHTALAAKVAEETERLDSNSSWNETSRKRLKYGTRSLVAQTLKLEN